MLSQAFTDGETIPAKYTCDGQDINPPLTIGNIPEGTKSLALVIDDIDTPSGTWIHWLVWNIEPAAYLDIGENTTPAGSTTGRNGFGKSAYGGPCPPDRAHRYVFSVYALDRHLILPAGSGKQDVLNAANTRILGSARITGLYVRPRR
ncbi:hypothetical protein A2Z33_05390 [Candidatus Gottesmanbacteria bacterium RBG_16_52_11]|uniref:Kinase inhibitor n=1 Tax=Candidatus Gottesmanbacteria bacterium RBG_16_52_11 TaxID=1798374 RepID=A0A1F5YMB1_9BACT|nr:MAG: hypothetical protein A2Z33_05390 [Candidatus Gottesmanbacteria bacterium RBG_16_52_11]